MKTALIIWTMIGMVALFATSEAVAQHPIEIERSTAQGDYLQALVAFDKLPSRRATSTSVIAAGKSAWALGLDERAIKEFDKALRDPSLNDVQRGRILLSRGVIEFQEERSQVAALYAEKAVQALVEPSPLRAQAWSLWGDSLAKQNAWGSAEEKYSNAQKETAGDGVIDAHFKLGRCQMHLGKLEEARVNFENVPLQHEHAPAAIRNLALVALEQKRYTQATFWLEQGRQYFADDFLDSWVDYALVVAAANSHDREKVVSIRDAAIKKYPPSDYWFTLLNSAAEAYLWSDSRQAVALAVPDRAGQL